MIFVFKIQLEELVMKTKTKKNEDRMFRTELHYAASDRDVKKVKELISLGTDVNAQDSAGWTPLHFAAQSQSTEIAHILIDAGAEVDIKDILGNTPLSKAVFNYTDDGSLVELLRKCGADPFARNNYGQTPVGLARLIANYDVAKFFEDLPYDESNSQ
jgi:ankyrin repeat protein